MSFEIADTTWEGFPTRTLRTEDRSLAATFASQIGMVGCALEHEGAQLLGQRRGLGAYESQGSTMGIPLLHPFANRLSGFEYEAGGRRVKLDPDCPLLRFDENGLPIHGLLAASPYWRVTAREADEGSASLSAELDFGAHPELLEAFPFPHRIGMDVTLTDGALRVATSVEPTGDTAVPISFGYHPYLQLPGVPRAEWEIELPVGTHILTDERGIPNGRTEPAGSLNGPLGEREFDDGYTDVGSPAVFALAGGGRRIELEFLGGYDFAQVYAPRGQELIAFEPMTAATNALVAGGPSLTLVEPGDRYDAAFELRVTRS